MKKFCFLTILAIIFLSLPAVAENSQKIEIMVNVANVRATPGLEGKIVGKAYLGDQFSVINEEGSWFKIIFKPNEDGEKKFGYVYKTITKVITGKKISSTPPLEKEKAKIENEKAKKENKKIEKEKKIGEKEKKKAEKEKKKAERKAEREKKSAARKVERAKKKAEKKAEKEKKRAEKEKLKAQEKKSDLKVVKKKKDKQDILFKGFFTKFGYMTSPKVDSLGDKWVVDLGFDSPIGQYATWGLELQPYFRSYSAPLINFTASNLVTNIFLNVKGGINLGQLWDKLKIMTIYLGGGPGVSLGYLYSDFAGVTGSQFDVFFAWHIVYGAEFKLGKMNIIVEFQSNKVINPDIDPSTQSSRYFLVGLRF